MRHDLAILGAGGFGREMALMIGQMNGAGAEWDLIGFFDDGKKFDEQVDGFRILGGLSALNTWKTPLAVVVAIADPEIRKTVVRRIRNDHVYFPVIKHPTSMTGNPRNSIGRGTILTAGTVLTTGIEIGEFVVVSLLSTIGHDVKIGNFTSIMPGCNVSGNVAIGEAAFVGTGVKVLQNLSLGDRCTVGAGAVVTKSVSPGKTVFGVPAR